MLSDVVNYRIVSSGFVVRAQTARLYTSGMVLLRSYAVTTPASLTSVDPTLYNCAAFKDVALASCYDGIACVTQHTSAMPQSFYVSTGSNAVAGSAAANGYAPMIITLTGAPGAATPVVIEYTIHYELTFNDDSGLNLAATPAPPANMVLTAAAARVTSVIPAFFEKGAKLAGEYILKRAAEALATRFGGPAAGYATHMALTVD